MLNFSQLRTSTLLGFLAILLWSTTVAFARSISENLGPFTAGASIYLLAGLLLYIARFSNKRTFRNSNIQTSLYIFGCGALFLIYTTSFYIAVNLASSRTQTLEVGLINYLWPGLTILFSLPIFGKKANLWLIPGSLIAFAGVFLALTQGTSLTWVSFASNIQNSPLPYFIGLVAAISWALYSNLSRLWGGTETDGSVPLFCLSTGVFFAFLALIFPEKASWNPQVILEILIFSSATALAYVSWDTSMRKGNMTLVAAGSYFIPFLSTIVSSLILRITPVPSLWLGCLLIILGSLMSWRSLQ